MDKEVVRAIILKSGMKVEALEGQFFHDSKSGKSVGLWQAEPLRLLKRFRMSNVLWKLLKE